MVIIMRLIDADALIKALNENGVPYRRDVQATIEATPTFKENNCSNCATKKKNCIGDRIWCELVQCDFPVNGYCSYWRGE